MGKEALFKARLAKELRLLGFYVQTIETTTGRGVPDLYICWQYMSAWIEVKAPTHNKIEIRPEQRVWLTLVGIKNDVDIFVIAEHQNDKTISLSYPKQYIESRFSHKDVCGTFKTTKDICKFLCLSLMEKNRLYKSFLESMQESRKLR